MKPRLRTSSGFISKCQHEIFRIGLDMLAEFLGPDSAARAGDSPPGRVTQQCPSVPRSEIDDARQRRAGMKGLAADNDDILQHA